MLSYDSCGVLLYAFFIAWFVYVLSYMKLWASSSLSAIVSISLFFLQILTISLVFQYVACYYLFKWFSELVLK